MSDININREVEVITIPYGQKKILYPGTIVSIRQYNGGSFTLYVEKTLVFLQSKNADAIGKKSEELPSDIFDIKPQQEIDELLIWKQMKTIYDPEISINIVDLGLIYDVYTERLESNNYYVGVQMTLTSPGCGMGTVLVSEVEEKVKMFKNIDKVDVALVFHPPWNQSMMSEEARLHFGMI